MADQPYENMIIPATLHPELEEPNAWQALEEAIDH